jgi:quaternary ammonium compound-resistance protein SugE
VTSWIILFFAGISEVVWVFGLKASHGFTKVIPSTVTVVFSCLSLYLLALASRDIPVNISYIVWVGIGSVGTFLGCIFLYGDRVTLTQVLFFCLIVLGIIGLKLSALETS